MTVPPPDPTGLALLKQALDLPTQVLDLGCGLVRDLIGEPVKVAGGMLSDQVYWWQWRNRVRIAHRAAEILEHVGIARRIVPPSFLLPLLEATGNVDDPDLQEMWARLLASGVAADEHQHPMWVKILAQMSAEDARVFAEVCSESDAVGEINFTTTGTPDPAERRYPQLVRLMSLDLVMPIKNADSCGGGAHLEGASPWDIDLVAAPTLLGAQFRRAIIPKRTADVVIRLEK